MKNLALWIITIGLVVGTAGITMAQDSTTTQQTTTTTTTQSNDATPQSDTTMGPQNDAAPASPDSHSNVRTLTGCLRKGDSAREYSLMGQDGSTWEIRSDAVDLASHVGQTVTITGAVAHSTMHGMKEDTKREAQEHGMDKSATEHGHLTVTNMSIVSNSCSQ